MKNIVLSAIVVASIFTGCGDSSACCSADAVKDLSPNAANIPPIAKITDLANNTTITVGQSVTANGTSSTDRDGTISTYTWTVDGVNSDTTANPTFTFNTAGNHEVCLSVTDNDNLKSANTECRTVIVNAVDSTPTPVVPTAIITLTDSDSALVKYSLHTFSCADSHDNDALGTGPEIATCNWEIQSYRVKNGTEVPYRNCSTTVRDGKAVQICPLVTRIVATLTVTDNDGQTASTTKEYTEFQ